MSNEFYGFDDPDFAVPGLVRTDDVLAPHHLMNLFTCGPEDEYDGPDLDDCGGVVQVCDGEWRLEPDGLWRFWRLADAAPGDRA